MRPWKIVLPSAIAAICAVAAMLRPGLTVAPDHLAAFLLPRLPALALTLIAVYALIAIVSTAGGLIAAALDLSRYLGRTDAVSQAGAALDWIAAFDATPLRTLVPRPVGALPKSARHSTTILLDARFDPRAARAEAAQVYYLWLARTHCLSALVFLAAIVALGFAQGEGEAAFLAGGIPTGPAVLVLVGLLLLVLLGRFAIDVTIAPLVDAVSRLPWEQVDAGRLRYAVDLLETARIDAVMSGRSVAGIPSELPERLAGVFEEGGRTLAAAGERLSAATEAQGAAIDRFAAVMRENMPAPPSGEPVDGIAAARLAALQTAIEALTAQLGRDAVTEPPAGSAEEDRQVFAAAIERLSAATETQGAATRAAIDRFAAVMRENMPAPPRDEPVDGIAAARLAALQTAIEALTAQLGRAPLAGSAEEDRQVLAAAIERLSAATEAQGAATRAAINGFAAVMRENKPAPPGGERVDGIAAARLAALQTAIEALTAQLGRDAVTEPPAGSSEEDQEGLAAAIERLSAATETQGAATRSAIDGLAAIMRENAPSIPSIEQFAEVSGSGARQVSVEALAEELEQLTALFDVARQGSSTVEATRLRDGPPDESAAEVLPKS
jgi:hypothetical protein